MCPGGTQTPSPYRRGWWLLLWGYLLLTSLFFETLERSWKCVPTKRAVFRWLSLRLQGLPRWRFKGRACSALVRLIRLLPLPGWGCRFLLVRSFPQHKRMLLCHPSRTLNQTIKKEVRFLHFHRWLQMRQKGRPKKVLNEKYWSFYWSSQGWLVVGWSYLKKRAFTVTVGSVIGRINATGRRHLGGMCVCACAR